MISGTVTFNLQEEVTQSVLFISTVLKDNVCQRLRRCSIEMIIVIIILTKRKPVSTNLTTNVPRYFFSSRHEVKYSSLGKRLLLITEFKVI